MTQLDARLNDLLEPLRTHGVGELLHALAGAIDAGAEVTPEPLRRDGDGSVLREGPLSLPERGDLLTVRDGRRLVQRVDGTLVEGFEPVTLVADGGFTTVISPFRWGAAEARIEAVQARPDWQPIRLWYLDWFQPKMGDVAPDLCGALHAMQGPYQTDGGWCLEIDFGSAPTAAVPALIAACGRTGALRLRIGHGL